MAGCMLRTCTVWGSCHRYVSTFRKHRPTMCEQYRKLLLTQQHSNTWPQQQLLLSGCYCCLHPQRDAVFNVTGCAVFACGCSTALWAWTTAAALVHQGDIKMVSSKKGFDWAHYLLAPTMTMSGVCRPTGTSLVQAPKNNRPKMGLWT